MVNPKVPVATKSSKTFGRASGVLLHPTALPGGTLAGAGRFLDWLVAAGQQWWQVLPLGPPDESGSPYSSGSAFAGSPALLARPDARVTADEIEAFVASHPSWSGAWAAHAGRDALAMQVRFEREWGAVRRRANDVGVRILGDLAFYVAPGSADHVAFPELFQTGEVAGVPPDDWSATGQRWGNPVYDWNTMRRTRFRWWIQRLRRAFELVDALRIDHFRGFVAYWSIPAHLRTARQGRWRRAPGRALFDAVFAELGPQPLVAEDLGIITPPVEALRRRYGMLGSYVMQFAFADDLKNPLPAPAGDDIVVYTGTHDNDTSAGWWASASKRTRARVDEALAELGINEPDPSWKLIRAALAHPGRVAMLPMQDVLGLGSEARINRPGTSEGNWCWRMPSSALRTDRARRLADLTEATGRTEPALVLNPSGANP